MPGRKSQGENFPGKLRQSKALMFMGTAESRADVQGKKHAQKRNEKMLKLSSRAATPLHDRNTQNQKEEKISST